MAHAHSHEAPPVDRRVGRLLALLVLPFVALTGIGLLVLWPDDSTPVPDAVGPPARLRDASITALRTGPCTGTTEEQDVPCQFARLRLEGRGGSAGLEVTLGAGFPELSRGDRIVVGVAGGEYYFHDFQRDRPLLLLGLLFAAAVVALARWRGLLALAGLAISMLVLVKFVLPAILEGSSPVAVSLVGAAAVMFVALYLAHGFNARTSTAVIGTMASLLVTGMLAAVFVEAGQLSGLVSEEAGSLQALAGNVDLRGLLLGGVIIGSLGVLDDVTVTQASAVWELRAANPTAGFTTLFGPAMRIGRDHVASTVNTLVLAYAGASLPLLVLFSLSDASLSRVLTGELIGTEVVRTLVGSIGLIASVPITTALAAYVASRRPAAASSPAAPPGPGPGPVA